MLNHFKKRLASYESLIKKETQWKKAMSTNKNSSTLHIADPHIPAAEAL